MKAGRSVTAEPASRSEPGLTRTVTIRHDRRRRGHLELAGRILSCPAGTYIRQARIPRAAASRRVDGLRHGSEDLEPQVETGETEKLGEHGRRGSQAQGTAQQGGAAADAD